MSPGAPVLGNRALNRALLARQGLLARWELTVPEALERLVGMQSQAPGAPYVGLWTRLEGFTPDQLAHRMLDRSAVRIALMRSTIFLVTARDCLGLRPVMQSVSERQFRSGRAARVADVDLDKLAGLARRIVEEEPRTPDQLGALLSDEFPDVPSQDLAAAARTRLPLVQVTPRGVWGQSKAAFHTTAEKWLGQELSRDTAPDDAILRYLRAFGPATVADIQTWSGLAGVRAHMQRLRPALRSFRNERGQELFDVPDGLLPHPETAAPVRILPEFDNMLLSHADRSRLFDDTHRMRFMTVNGLVKSTYLIDGFVSGTCTVNRTKSLSTLTIEPFGTLRRADRSALKAEAAGLLSFVAPDDDHRIEFAD